MLLGIRKTFLRIKFEFSFRDDLVPLHGSERVIALLTSGIPDLKFYGGVI